MKLYTALLVGLLAAASCKDKKQGFGKGQPSFQDARPYPVAVVYSGAATIYFSFPASIVGQQIVEIRPKVDGFIQDIYVDEGSMVSKGQLLFQLNNPLYEQAVRSMSAAVKVAEADVKTAEMNVEKVKPLAEKEIVSKFELQTAGYTLLSRKAALEAAQANLNNANANLQYTFIRSPVSGLMGNLPYKVGSLVSSTSQNPLTTVVDTKNILAYFSLNEKILLAIIKNLSGNTLQEKLKNIKAIYLILPNGNRYNQPGVIQSANGLVNAQTGSSNFKGLFPNPDGLIRSGNSGTVEIPVSLDSALIIPQTSVFEMQGKKFVYRLNEKDSIIGTSISVSQNNLNGFYIVQNGLTARDRIVTDGIASLRPGMKVKPMIQKYDSLYQFNVIK